MTDGTIESLFGNTMVIGPGQNAPAICDALDVTRVPGEPAQDALQRALGGERTTVVLDNLDLTEGKTRELREKRFMKIISLAPEVL